MAKQLQEMTDDEMADLRAEYDREQQAARASGDTDIVRDMRAKKLGIQREIDRRHAGQGAARAEYIISGAGNIASREQVDGLGG